MKVFLSKAPNVLLESVEMLYAYVNEIPVRELGRKLLHSGSYHAENDGHGMRWDVTQ